MSYNGSGIYTLPGAQLVNGEVVSASENNQFRNDVATALNTAWTRDGQSPATGNIPMASHKFTGLAPGGEPGDSVRYEQVTTDVNISGGSINGNVDISVSNIIESTSGGFKFPDGTVQVTSLSPYFRNWNIFTSSGTYTVGSGVTSIRAYAIGAGGNGSYGTTTNRSGGGGGGCAYGTISVTPGDEFTITISAGVAKLTYGGVDYLVANPGSNGGNLAGGNGGTATKDAAVTDGGAYTGGKGGAGDVVNSGPTYWVGCGGGGSSASPLGNGYDAGDAVSIYSTGGSGIGGAGNSNGGGGAGGSASTVSAPGGTMAVSGGANGINSRGITNQYADPLIANAISPGSVAAGGAGAGGANSKDGGDWGGGSPGVGAVVDINGGNGGIGGGGGGGNGRSDYSANIGGNGGNGGYGGGGGGGRAAGGAGGGAIVLIYA